MPSITFLGAARTVTGSKYLLDTGTASAHRCGLFQGLKELRERNWQDLPIRGVRDRRHRPDPRAPRSLRLPAAAGGAGLSRPRVLHGRHAGSLPDRAARRRPDPGRRRGEREPARVTRSTRRRCRSTARRTPFRAVSLLQPVGYDRPCRSRRHRSRVHQRRPSARIVVRARARSGGQTILFGGDLGRFDRPVLPDPDDGRRSGLPAGRVHLRRSRARARR